MSADSLIGHMTRELVEAGIEIHFHPKKYITSDDGGVISGGFDEENKHLELALKRDDWLLIFAHEYCHFKQWEEGLFDDVVMIAAYSVFTPWLAKKREVPPEMLETFIRKMQWLERDNEQRTMDLLDKFRVDYDKEDYIKRTNVYLISYELCRRFRRWHKKPIYDVPELLDLVSGEELLSEEEWGEIPEGFEELVFSCYEGLDNSEEENE